MKWLLIWILLTPTGEATTVVDENRFTTKAKCEAYAKACPRKTDTKLAHACVWPK